MSVSIATDRCPVGDVGVEARCVVPSRLERHERTYRALAAELATELATIGFISPGSVVSRYTSCGKPGCRCRADPPQRHGPYYQWSRAVAGKTLSRRLTEAEAQAYQGWIANRRRIEGLIAQMEQTSAAAADLLLHRAAPTNPRQIAKP